MAENFLALIQAIDVAVNHREVIGSVSLTIMGDPIAPRPNLFVAAMLHSW